MNTPDVKTKRPPPRGDPKGSPKAAGLNGYHGVLRRRAEASLRGRSKPPARDADPRRTLHELQIHQIELEMQNAQLRENSVQMEDLLGKYTDLFDFAPVGYFALDQQGLILEANLTGAALLGVERSLLVRRRLQVFVPLAQRPGFEKFLTTVFAGPGKQAHETSLRKQGGDVFWAGLHAVQAVADETGRRCRMSVSDISVLKRAELVVRQNEALLSTLVQQVPVGMYIVDDGLKMSQANPTATEVFRDIRPLIGRDLPEMLHLLWPKKIAVGILGRFRHTLKTGDPYVSPEFTRRRRDTRAVRSYDWQLRRIVLPGGRHGVVCFFTDVTERKQAEENRLRVKILGASNRKLEQEIVRRQKTEKALRRTERIRARLLKESMAMQGRLRDLARQVLVAQEEERKVISRELHDDIAQILTAINLHLVTLGRDATTDTRLLKRKISRTRRLVEKSVDIVHRFARELRPASLDDLGLIPALHDYLKDFTKRTGVRVRFAVFPEVEQLEGGGRTVLYRVAQSALTNIARHAMASHVTVRIQKVANAVRMEVHDDGRSFDVQKVAAAKGRKRLGLLGMRERVEMIGGAFEIDSSPDSGTTVRAQIPFTGPPAKLAASRKPTPAEENS